MNAWRAAAELRSCRGEKREECNENGNGKNHDGEEGEQVDRGVDVRMACKAWEAADHVKVLATVAGEVDDGQVELDSLRRELEMLRCTAREEVLS